MKTSPMNRRRFLLGTAAAFVAAKLPIPNAAPTLSGFRYTATGVLTVVVTGDSTGTMYVWITDEYGRKSKVSSCTVEIS